MREKVLSLDVDGVIAAFAGSHWKFFEDLEEEHLIRVELNRECLYVVELKYSDDVEKKKLVDKLFGARFFRQRTRITNDY